MQVITCTVIGKTFKVDAGSELSNEILNALKRECQNDKPLPKLYAKQKRQLVAFAMAEAEQYPNTHSMRYSIMRDICAALFGIKK